MIRMIIGAALCLLFVFIVFGALTDPGDPSPRETILGALVLLLVPGVVLFYFGRRARARPQPDMTSSASKATCGRCRRPLERELYDFSDPIQRATGRCFLGTVCTNCQWVECYRCRGRVGAPCSKCNGSVSPAYERLFV